MDDYYIDPAQVDEWRRTASMFAHDHRDVIEQLRKQLHECYRENKCIDPDRAQRISDRIRKEQERV